MTGDVDNPRPGVSIEMGGFIDSGSILFVKFYIKRAGAGEYNGTIISLSMGLCWSFVDCTVRIP